MASFKRKAVTASQSGETCYTTPTGKVGLSIGMLAANKVEQIEYISVDINGVFIIKNAPVPPGSTLSVLDGKLAIESEEVLTVTASADSSIDFTATILEL